MTERVRITGAHITPVAFADPPLLNAAGVHEPYAIRAIIQLDTDCGLVGLGETYADDAHLRRLQRAAEAIAGQDVFALNAMWRLVHESLAGDTGSDSHGLTGAISTAGTVDRTFAAFEVAALDVQGHLLGRPVSDLLGGRVRDRVPFSAYLFYKWAGHPGRPDDSWGAALDPDAIVGQARRMIAEYGFTAIKLKGGVFAPAQEVEAVHALRTEFADLPLRIDPNAAWSVDTSLRVASALDGVIEYLEDPTAGLDGMAAVARAASMPLATNMCVVGFDDLAPAVARGSVGVLLSDHHYWGGLQRSRLLAGTCETFGLGVSMHSNSHLGISLAAMVQLGAAIPNLAYACDTHWPWKTQDVVPVGTFRFVDGSVEASDLPGLGVTLDQDALGELHELYLTCGLRNRDDTGYMQSIEPEYTRRIW
ncbi:MAG TPA: glucarate dehydratase family protein [Jatrophihabitantaceae bacterium]|jgi:glucarate dehydratase|nr:glucarate dehydratase family protein [Jatrophihabitantaceae bacterium]